MYSSCSPPLSLSLPLERCKMVTKKDLIQLNPFCYEIPIGFRPDMRVVARFYSDPSLLDSLMKDQSLSQLINTTTLPGVVAPALAMPDIHEGYGFPIGGVVATRMPDGVISPGGVGYDINCGVRLLGTQMERGEITPFLTQLLSLIHLSCPSGVGKEGPMRLSPNELGRVLREGAHWAMKKGFASQSDLDRTEEKGCLAGADPQAVSSRAHDRGKNQLGTLGAGNHFIEIDVVSEIFNPLAATRMGLFPEQVVVQLHSGSRGLGHQVCSDYVKTFQKSIGRYGWNLPDRELVCAPVSSPEGQAYLSAMNAAANYAFANRQVLAHRIRDSFARALAGKVRRHHVYQIYDIAHNMAKIETHEVNGKHVSVCVHRKGATRALGPGSPALPPDYRDVGQPVLVPGSMGTSSWVLAGTEAAMQFTFGSCCHGAGRIMSRSQAKKRIRGAALREELEAGGIRVQPGSLSGLAEEAPLAYKDVDRVVAVVHAAGIAKKVARLVPIAVIKG
jgi:tRNA-splicing ligase RtcB (3'-phosphate/5'-hydroxy nucleic acid ligase)